MPPSVPYGVLNRTHPPDLPRDRGYDCKTWRQLDDLYRGGFQILERAKDYLPQAVGERSERHAERLGLASYFGYFGAIVNVYVAALFGRPPTVTPAQDADDPATPGEMPDRAVYDAFASNADFKGSSFGQVLRHAAECALVKQKALIAVDFPAVDVVASSRADTDALGLARPYVYDVHAEELIDWDYDYEIQRRADLGDGKQIDWTIGCFRFAVIKRRICTRESPYVDRSAPVEEFRVWTRLDDGTVVWELYRTPPMVDGAVNDQTMIERVSGPHPTTFREIPLVEIKIPETLWLGNIIGPLQLEHWRRRSALLGAQQRAMFVIPTVYLGSEGMEVGGEPPAEAAQDPHRGDDPRRQFEKKGYAVLGAKDKLRFEGPPTEAFKVIDEQLKDLVDEIHRVSGRMAASISSTASAVGRSGDSKAMDNKDFETVLGALAPIFKDAARRIYQTISEARGENVVWSVHGLDDYEEAIDRTAVIDEATKIGELDIPSPTFRKELRGQTALKLLPGLDSNTKTTILDEIKAATDAEANSATKSGGAAHQKVPQDDDENDESSPASSPEPQGPESTDEPPSQPTTPPQPRAR